MKPTGQVNFAFDAGLMFCLRDDREDGGLHVSFERSLNLQKAVEGAQSLLFLASQIQNEHSIKDLLNHCNHVPDKSIIENQFLKTA